MTQVRLRPPRLLTHRQRASPRSVSRVRVSEIRAPQTSRAIFTKKLGAGGATFSDRFAKNMNSRSSRNVDELLVRASERGLGEPLGVI